MRIHIPRNLVHVIPNRRKLNKKPLNIKPRLIHTNFTVQTHNTSKRPKRRKTSRLHTLLHANPLSLREPHTLRDRTLAPNLLTQRDLLENQ